MFAGRFIVEPNQQMRLRPLSPSQGKVRVQSCSTLKVAHRFM
jgi:hypothetical protein